VNLAVITCYFNPADYERLRENYVRFCEQEAGWDFFAMEAIWPGQRPTGCGAAIDAGPLNVLWQKERILNLIVESLPSRYDAVAWIDADVEFSNLLWRLDAVDALETHRAVQLFDTAVWLDCEGHSILELPASAVKCDPAGKNSHPGFAWAARRDVFPLYDQHPFGIGDALNLAAWTGQFGSPVVRSLPAEWRREYLLWALPVWNRVRGNVGHIPGECRHWWHGSREDRRYWSRMPALYDTGFLPSRDLKIGDNGLYELARDDVRAVVADYFGSRNEDD
jgi:hypothetical protein